MIDFLLYFLLPTFIFVTICFIVISKTNNENLMDFCGIVLFIFSPITLFLIFILNVIKKIKLDQYQHRLSKSINKEDLTYAEDWYEFQVDNLNLCYDFFGTPELHMCLSIVNQSDWNQLSLIYTEKKSKKLIDHIRYSLSNDEFDIINNDFTIKKINFQ